VQYCCVDVDNRAAAKRAVSHLVNLGHERIACITNALPDYSAALDRLKGYQDALSSAGITDNPRLVRYGNFDPESGYQQMNYLLDHQRGFSAIFVASDVVALGAMAAIRERGLRIPEDIALVGFDDVSVSKYLDPSLTTIQIPVIELARQASEMLISLIHGERPIQPLVLLDARLVVRKSCGALKESTQDGEAKR
jgi:LacI family transcriptional regulator